VVGEVEAAVRWRVVGMARCLLALMMMDRRYRLFVIGVDLERLGFPVALEEAVVEEGQRAVLLGLTSVWTAWEVAEEELGCRIGETGFGFGAVPSKTFVKERRISSGKYCMSGPGSLKGRS
jgi:hypothetical protein